MNLKSQEGKLCIVTGSLPNEGFGGNQVESWGVEVGREQSAFQLTAFKTRFFVLWYLLGKAYSALHLPSPPPPPSPFLLLPNLSQHYPWFRSTLIALALIKVESVFIDDKSDLEGEPDSSPVPTYLSFKGNERLGRNDVKVAGQAGKGDFRAAFPWCNAF